MAGHTLVSLRRWSGALLVSALLVCLAGMARPAMAMSMPMDMGMGTDARAVTVDHTPGPGYPHGTTAAQQAATDALGGDDHCPMVGAHCAAPKVVLGHEVQPGPVHGDVSGVVVCPHEVLVAQPNAPPSPVASPDLHRLCVSRT